MNWIYEGIPDIRGHFWICTVELKEHNLILCWFKKLSFYREVLSPVVSYIRGFFFIFSYWLTFFLKSSWLLFISHIPQHRVNVWHRRIIIVSLCLNHMCRRRDQLDFIVSCSSFLTGRERLCAVWYFEPITLFLFSFLSIMLKADEEQLKIQIWFFYTILLLLLQKHR